jgi:subtilisin family serine protease
MQLFKRKSARSIATVFIALAAMTASSSQAEAGLLGPSSDYLVKITPATQAAVESAIKNAGGTINARYQYAFNGFVIKLPDMLIPILKKIPNVLTVEKDMPVALSAIQQNQTPTPAWGIDRIDQREAIPTTSGYVSNYGYRSAGAGATIYIGDTGIYPNNDIAGRISSVGYSGISDGNGTVDCNGHGTHVSTTAAGTKYGIAKRATLVPVRILNCAGSGSYATVIAGLDWILSPLNTNPKNAAVLNLSIGGGASSIITDAVLKLTNAGITVVAAAGNDNADACNYSPASAPTAITVGSTMVNDAKSSFSNWGSCVDINAPGSGITGGWIGAPDAERTISGTSMATPHVTGAVAVFLGLNPGASVAQVTDAITGQATPNVLTGLTANTVNKLLYVSPTDGGPAIIPPAILIQNLTTITHKSVSATVEINPGNAPTTASFEVSKDQSFATGVTSINLTPTALSGGDVISLPVTVDSLTASSTYYFRALASNESGPFTTPVGSFKTLAPPITPPTAIATNPSAVTGYSVHLNGSVNANNGTTNVSFVFGTDPAFLTNTQTLVATQATVSGASTMAVGLDVSFLNGSTTYYYKIVAGNSAASVQSNVITFTTPAVVGIVPVVDTIRPTNGISAPSTVVTGIVNPMGQTTTIRFVYGAEPSLTVGQRVVTLPTQYTGVDSVTVTSEMVGLTPGYRFYYRFEAFNAAGITKPTPLTNVVNPIMPVINSTSASAQTTTTMTLSTSFNAGASNTRIYFIYGTSPLLDTGSVTVQGTPFAFTNALNNVSTVNLTGLTTGTRYYYRVMILAYTGPLMDLGGKLYGPIMTTETVYPPRSAQTITFNLPTSRFYGGAPTRLTATSSAGLPITFTTSTPNVCRITTVDSSSVLSYVDPISSSTNAGCVVTASQDGTYTVAPAASVSRTMIWSKETTVTTGTWAPATVVNETPLDLLVKSSSQLSLGENLAGATPLTVISKTPTVCQVGTVSYVGTSLSHTRVIVKSMWNGTCQIQATFAGASYWSASTSVITGTVSGMTSPQPGANAPQTIAFNTPANRAFGTPNPLVATATSKLPVTFTSLTPATCSVAQQSDGSFAAIAAAGLVGDANECQIRASQAGDDRWAPATSVNQIFRWSRTAQVITFIAPTSRFIGGAGSMISATSTSGLPVTVSVTTPAVCSITTIDTVTVLNYLNPVTTANSVQCLLVATQVGNDTYAPAIGVYRTVTWMKEATRITPTWASAIPSAGSTLNIAVSSASQPVLNENNFGRTAATVVSLTPTVCKVNSVLFQESSTIQTKAVVASLWNGTCSLQVTYLGNSYWLGSSLTFSTTVSGMTTPSAGANAAQVISFGTPPNSAFTTLVPLVATAGSKLPVAFASTTPATCSVITKPDGSFAAQAVAGLTGDNNTCSIQATQPGDTAWAAAAPAVRSFKWTRLAQTITFVTPTSRFYGGPVTKLVATSSSGLPVVLTSLSQSICSVTQVDSDTVITYASPLPAASTVSCVLAANQVGNGTYLPASQITRSVALAKEATTTRSTWGGALTASGTNLDLQVVSTSQPTLNELLAGTTPLAVTSRTPNTCSVGDVFYQGNSTVHTRAVIKALWNGACQIQVVFAGNSYWLPSTTVVSLGISGMVTPQAGANVAQTISFNTPPNREFGFSYPVTNVTASSKLPVTLVSTTPQVCVVTETTPGAWSVSAVAGVGGNSVPCSIQATQPGVNQVWAPAAPVTRTFLWNKAAMAVSIYNATSTRVGVGPHNVIAAYAYYWGVNNVATPSLSGDLVVTTTTPAVCQVLGTTPVQIGKGTYTQASIKGLTNGVCTTTWTNIGNEIRTSVTLTHSFTVSGIK